MIIYVSSDTVQFYLCFLPCFVMGFFCIWMLLFGWFWRFDWNTHAGLGQLKSACTVLIHMYLLTTDSTHSNSTAFFNYLSGRNIFECASVNPHAPTLHRVLMVDSAKSYVYNLFFVFCLFVFYHCQKKTEPRCKQSVGTYRGNVDLSTSQGLTMNWSIENMRGTFVIQKYS